MSEQEMPQCPNCNSTMRDNTAFYACDSCGKRWMPVPLSIPTQWKEVKLATTQPTVGSDGGGPLREHWPLVNRGRQFKGPYRPWTDEMVAAFARKQLRQAAEIARRKGMLFESLAAEIEKLAD